MPLPAGSSAISRGVAGAAWLCGRDVKRSVQWGQVFLSPKKEGALPGGDPDQPGDIRGRPAKRANPLQRAYKSLRGQIRGVLYTAGMRQMIAINAAHMTPLQLSKRLRVVTGLRSQPGIIHAGILFSDSHKGCHATPVYTQW